MNESTVTFWQTMTFVQILLKAKIMGLKARMKMTLMQLQAMLAGRVCLMDSGKSTAGKRVR